MTNGLSKSRALDGIRKKFLGEVDGAWSIIDYPEMMCKHIQNKHIVCSTETIQFTMKTPYLGNIAWNDAAWCVRSRASKFKRSIRAAQLIQPPRPGNIRKTLDASR